MRCSILLLALAGCSPATAVPAAPPAAASPLPAARPALVDTGDPLPARRPEGPDCRGGDRWLATEPHVPLTLVVAGSGYCLDDFRPAAQCCAAWARLGDAWTSVDFWGAPTGTHTIAGGEGYDLTQCYELSFETDVSALLVRGDRPWEAPAQAAWSPDDTQQRAAYALGAAIDTVVARAPPTIDSGEAARESPLERRAVFFQLAPAAEAAAPTRFVAIGGRALVVAGLDRGGAWRVLYLDASWGLDNPYVGDPYRVIGIFDMDRDGFPEIIVHRHSGDGWDDVVLACDHDSTFRLWRVVAESVGGSTA